MTPEWIALAAVALLGWALAVVGWGAALHYVGKIDRLEERLGRMKRLNDRDRGA